MDTVLYSAKFDYDKERDDVLSFKKGDKFEVTHKPDDKWWAAKRLGDGAVGYIPAMYFEPTKERIVGRLIPEEIRQTAEHNIHLQALLELQKKVKPIPDKVVQKALIAADKNPTFTHRKFIENKKNGDDEFDDDGIPFHHKCIADNVGNNNEEDDDLPFHMKYYMQGKDGPVSPTELSESGELLKPKPLPNPVLSSKPHQDLHRELKMKNKNGKSELLAKPELAKAFEARRKTQKMKEVEEAKKKNRTSLDIKLMKQQEKLKEEETKMKEKSISEDDTSKPEFMKVKLRSRTNSDVQDNAAT